MALKNRNAIRKVLNDPCNLVLWPLYRIVNYSLFWKSLSEHLFPSGWTWTMLLALFIFHPEQLKIFLWIMNFINLAFANCNEQFELLNTQLFSRKSHSTVYTGVWTLEMEMECRRVLFALLRPWKGSSLAPNSKYFLNDTACGRYKYLCVE